MMRVLRFLLLTVILPVTLNVFAYYGFVSNYTRYVFSEGGFLAQYDSGIYRYRLLGKKLLLALHEALERHQLAVGGIDEGALALLDPQGSLLFYHSYFLLNTFFFSLTATALYLIFRHDSVKLSERERDLTLLSLLLVIAVSQFVVVPYDTLSYWLLCCAIYLNLSPRRSLLRTIGLPALVVVGTLTRESTALVVSFCVTTYVLQRGWEQIRQTREIAVLSSCFLATYLSLRLYFGFDRFPNVDLQFTANLGEKGIVSLLFLFSILTVFLSDSARARAAAVFLLFSLPYLLAVILVGVLFEIRLWIPLIIGVAVLTSLDFKQLSRAD